MKSRSIIYEVCPGLRSRLRIPGRSFLPDFAGDQCKEGNSALNRPFCPTKFAAEEQQTQRNKNECRSWRNNHDDPDPEEQPSGNADHCSAQQRVHFIELKPAADFFCPCIHIGSHHGEIIAGQLI